jgi:tetratricopeptide (TPR) repeat protein
MHRFVLACWLLAAAALSAPPATADDNATCYSKTVPPDAGIAACDRLIQSGKSSRTAAHLWRGTFFMQKEDWDRALADFSEVIRRDPRNASAYNRRGFVHLEKLAFDRAIADFDQAVRLNPRSEHNYNNRAYALIRKGEIERALADLKQALAINPKSISALNNRGLAYAQKGLHDIAILDYDEALRIDPRSYESLLNRGVAFREKGDFERALVDFALAGKIDPRRANPSFHRGFIWRAKGQLDNAIAEFNVAIKLAPDAADALAYRGLAYEGQGDYERARADYRAAIAAPAKYVLTPRSHEMARVRLALLSGSDQRAPAAPTREAAPASGRRIALVIGNAAYAGVSALANPVNDARGVAAELRRIGFAVSEGVDLDRAGMQRLLGNFLRDAATAKVALLFYAGHGMQIDGRNYLVPVDASFAPGSDPAADMTIVDTVLAGLSDQLRTNIVILDACRDNPLAQKVAAQAGASRSLTRSGLAAPSGLGAGATIGAGTLIAFATAPGEVALDGAGANSPFSAALVRHLGTPGIEVQQMLTRVRADVVATTGNKQVPWSNSSLLGEVYLAGAK